MQLKRALEQHIAVFGESGSGKTVLLSSFYGATQEPEYLQTSLFHVVADDIGQGSRLHRNYLGMRDSARLPEATRFSSTSYAFSVKPKEGKAKPRDAKQFDALHLVWHDYPGEWFEQDVSGPEEAQRRVDTFRSLLGADVALLLVDGQRLLDNTGEEERYLKSLLGNFRNGLLALKDDLLEDGKPLVKFPRIWILALSKADLLPDINVFNFRDLLIDKAIDDLDELRKVLAGLIESSDALSVGEDFVLLSSAKFEPNRIEVTERVGLDLVLPLAAVFPFERHFRWVAEKQLGAKVVEELLGGAGALAAALIGKPKKSKNPKDRLVALVGRDVLTAVMRAAAELAGDRLRQRNEAARNQQDYVSAALTGFQLDLDVGEDKRVLLRSRR
jgi:hypothetical protein